ncbi:MAG: hypothetical protein ACWA5R_02565 [bacterium]
MFSEIKTMAKSMAIQEADDMPRMVRKVTGVTKQEDQPSDYQYWKTRPFSERIDAIEILRQSWMSFQKNAPQRLQRIYRVTQQS